jgi:hypothetical protein
MGFCNCLLLFPKNTWEIVQNHQQHTQSPLVDERDWLWKLDIPKEWGQEFEVAQNQLGVHCAGPSQIETVREKATNEIAMANHIQPVESESRHSPRLEHEQGLPLKVHQIIS